MSSLCLIAAVGAKTLAIGNDNKLLWRIPPDMKRFVALTTGHPVIMGRKTWESIPPRFRPLSERINFVVTRQKSYEAAGAQVAPSVHVAVREAMRQANGGCVFVIGGSELYEQTLHTADRIYLTLVHDDTDGDVHFPANYRQEFPCVEGSEEHEHEGLRFTYETRTH